MEALVADSPEVCRAGRQAVYLISLAVILRKELAGYLKLFIVVPRHGRRDKARTRAADRSNGGFVRCDPLVLVAVGVVKIAFKGVALTACFADDGTHNGIVGTAAVAGGFVERC